MFEFDTQLLVDVYDTEMLRLLKENVILKAKLKAAEQVTNELVSLLPAEDGSSPAEEDSSEDADER